MTSVEFYSRKSTLLLNPSNSNCLTTLSAMLTSITLENCCFILYGSVWYLQEFCKINNPNLTNSLQSLFHHRLVADLSIFQPLFSRKLLLEIKNIIPDPVRRVRTTRSSIYHTLSKLHYLIHKLYLTNHLSFLELLNCGTHCHPLLPLNPTICHLLNLTSTNLILSPSPLKLPHFLSFSFVGALL